MKHLSSYLFSGILLALFHADAAAQKLINSFETDKELKSVQAGKGVQARQSTDFPALNRHSLQCIFPANGGELRLVELNVSNWNEDPAVKKSGADALLLFVWSERPAQVSLVVEDSAGNQSAKQFSLRQGANHLQVAFAAFKGFDMAKVSSLLLKTADSASLYLDYIALDQYQKVFDAKGRWDVDYTDAIITPHFPWATNFANGKIKAYSISPIFDGRGIIELSERLALDFTTTTIGRSAGINRWGFGDFYDRRNPMSHDGSYPYNLAFNYIADDIMFNPEYDVIIWPGLHPWEDYPRALRQALLERVKKGTGLVLLYPASKPGGENDFTAFSPLAVKPSVNIDSIMKLYHSKANIWPLMDTSAWVKTGDHYITRGVELGALPMGQMGVVPCADNGQALIRTADGNPVVSVKTYGKGRIVAMAYPENGFIPKLKNPWETGLSYPFWEHMWSLVARSVVWAAQKEPSSHIARAEASANALEVFFDNIGNNDSLRINIQDDFGVVETSYTMPLNSSKNGSVKIPLAATVHGGEHFAALQLTNAKGVLDWYALKFSRAQQAKIRAVDSELDEIPAGKAIKTSVFVNAEKPFAGTLSAFLYDNYDRLVSTQSKPVNFSGDRKYEFILDSKNILSHLGRVEFILSANNRQQDRKKKEIFFHQPRKWDDYDVTMYHFGPNPVPGTWSAIDAQLKNMHVTTLAAYTMEQSKHANYKVQAETRISGVESPDNGPDLEYYDSIKAKYLETGDKRVLARKYGLNDSVYLRAVREEMYKMIPAWRKFSPSAYYIYEEPSVTRYDDALDLDFSEITLKAMREWLRGIYPSLQDLNRQWGTGFASWEQVVPDDYREAQERGNYSSWADHRSFMEKTWSDQFRYVQDVLHEIDPGGLVQLSGTQASGAHNGYDYSQLDKHVGQMNPYDIGNQLEYHHDFNPDLKVSGQAGYGASGKKVLHDFYEHIFLNETGGAYIFWQQSSLNPDLSYCASGLDMKNGFYEMREKGIGKLFASFQPENEHKIAIHYSYPSIHAAWIVDGVIKAGRNYGNSSETLGQLRKNLDGWVKILKDAGLGFDFIAYSGIENGDLISKGIKTLILPMSMALSDKEAAQIRAFVEHGGIVITDALAGVMDGHARFRTEQALADVWGIAAQSHSRNDLVTPRNDSQLTLKGATALSEKQGAPQLIYHSYGKGKAFMLNYFLDHYPEEKRTHTQEASLAKIKKVFEKAGIVPGIYFTGQNGKPVSGISKYAFSEDANAGRTDKKDSHADRPVGGNGNANGASSAIILGVLPDKQAAAQEINIHFKSAGHLYDIRNSRYIGRGEKFQVSVEPLVPGIYALLPDVIKGMSAKAAPAIKRGGAVDIRFSVEGGESLRLKSVANIYVYNPAGEKVDVYSDNAMIINNKGSYRFNTALNDPKGKWKIVVRETISGKQTELPLVLE